MKIHSFRYVILKILNNSLKTKLEILDMFYASYKRNKIIKLPFDIRKRFRGAINLMKEEGLVIEKYIYSKNDYQYSITKRGKEMLETTDGYLEEAEQDIKESIDDYVERNKLNDNISVW